MAKSILLILRLLSGSTAARTKSMFGMLNGMHALHGMKDANNKKKKKTKLAL